MEYGLFPNIANEDYHNWVFYPAVSSSQLRAIRNQTPSHVKNAIDGNAKKSTAALSFGDIAHKIILNNEIDTLVVQPLDILQRSGSRWFSFVNDNPGKAIVTLDQMKQVLAMSKQVKANPTASALLENCTDIELSGFWENRDYDFDCKMRADIINDDI